MTDVPPDELDTLLQPGGVRRAFQESAGAPLGVGHVVGDYRLTKELASGGMGVVYLAERADGSYAATVAIKIIKRGMDTDFILERFAQERQVLAMLRSHRNIAHLEDAGATASGQPYFVMEYIEGRHIDDFCDARGLDVRGRLRLFLSVCDAVDLAHQKLIVHRDIKPSNVLVREDGVVKLLDFGIAKVLSAEGRSETESLVSSLRLMTREYASPEQMRGEPVLPSSDIYSLGVVLFRLLTGQLPYSLGGLTYDAQARIVCEQPPLQASRVVAAAHPERQRQLRGDIDTILTKALQKEVARRYLTVDALADDIRRHLAGLPIKAVPDSLRYRSTKFLRRNIVPVTAAATLGGLLAAGTALVFWQAGVARSERARAERRFNDLRALATSFLFEFYDAIDNLAGSTTARKLAVARALDVFDSLSREARGDVGLQRDMAVAYTRVGDAQGYPYDANLGDREGALASYRKGLAVLETLVAANDPEARRLAAVLHQRLGEVKMTMNSVAEGLTHQRQAVSLLEPLLTADGVSRPIRRALAVGYLKVGEALESMRRPSEALASYRQAMELFGRQLALTPDDSEAIRDVTVGYSKIGDVLRLTGDSNGALETYRKGLEIRLANSAAHPDDAELKRDVASSHDRIATVLTDLGQLDDALKAERHALEIDERLARADPENADAQRDTATDLFSIGRILLKAGRRADALEVVRQALTIRERLVAATEDDLELKAELGLTLGQVAELTAVDDNGESLTRCRQADEIADAVIKSDAANPSFRELRATVHFACGEGLRARAMVGADRRTPPPTAADARQHYEAARQMLRALQEEGPISRDATNLLAQVESRIAEFAGSSTP